VLVTDLGLPGMDGYALLRAIRQDGTQPAFPAVAVSAYARLDDRSRALAAGFQAHVAKPVDPATLVRVLAADVHGPQATRHVAIALSSLGSDPVSVLLHWSPHSFRSPKADANA
jgi:CheY-like chemotaxis protein